MAAVFITMVMDLQRLRRTAIEPFHRLEVSSRSADSGDGWRAATTQQEVIAMKPEDLRRLGVAYSQASTETVHGND